VTQTAGREATGLTFYNRHDDGVDNKDGLEALKAAVNLASGGDNTAFIYYLEGDRIKVCAVQSGWVAASAGISSSWLGATPLGSIDYNRYWFVVDLSENYGSSFIHYKNPPAVAARSSVIKKSGNGSITAKMGQNGIKNTDGVFDDATVFSLDWVKRLLSDECVPLAVVAGFTDFGQVSRNTGALAAWLNNGVKTVRAAFPTICFKYGTNGSSSSRKFISTNFTPGEATTIINDNPNWTLIWYNTFVGISGHQTGGTGKLFLGTGGVVVIGTGVEGRHRTINKYVTMENECAVLRLHGKKWDNRGGPSDERTLDAFLSDNIRGMTQGGQRPLTIINRNDEILLHSENTSVWVPGLVDPDASLLMGSIAKFRERAWFLAFKHSTMGQLLTQREAQVYIKTQKGLLYAPIASVDNEAGTITLSMGETARVFRVGNVGEDSFNHINTLIESRGKNLMKEMKVDGIKDHLYRALSKRADKRAKDELAKIKSQLDLGSSKNVGSLFGNTSGEKIWGGVGEMFAVELFQSLGPPDWGCSVVDGHIFWFKDKLRYVNRNSGDKMSARQNREGAFVRYETPFNQLITLSRTPRGWGIMTRFWGVGLHPNVSGEKKSQGLCHGAVECSVLAEDKRGMNLIKDYNKRNGTFDLMEALKVVNYAAQLLEASVVAGDSGAGYNALNIQDANGKRMLPLMKWNAFDTESQPEDDRKRMEQAYKGAGRKMVWAMLPDLEALATKCLNSKWFWEPSKASKKKKKAKDGPALKQVAEDFRGRVPPPRDSATLEDILG